MAEPTAQKEIPLLSHTKIIFGVIVYIVLGEFLKDLIIFEFVEPYFYRLYPTVTAERYAEISEYLLLASVLIPIVLFFIVFPVNAANRTMTRLNKDAEEKNAALIREKKRLDEMFRYHSAVMLIIDQAKSGAIIDANQAALEFYGYEYEEITSMLISEINILPGSIIDAEMDRAHRRDKNVFIFSHRLKNGDVRRVEVHSTPLRDDEHSLLYSIIYDITEKLRMQAELEKSETRYRSLVESSTDHIFMFDREGVYITSNNQVAQFGLVGAEALIGKHLSEVYPPDTAQLYLGMITEVFASAQTVSFEHPLKEPKGLRYHVDTLYPIKKGAEVYAVGGICHDITDQKKVEEELKRNERSFNVAKKMIHLGVWVHDLEQDTHWWSDEQFRISGYIPDQIQPDRQQFLETIHPEDSQGVLTAIEKSLRDDVSYDVQYRVSRPDGTIRFVHSYGQVERNRTGIPTKMIATVLDITDRKADELERDRLIAELGRATREISELSGLLPICSHCKKVRDDKGYWKQIESYIEERSTAEFSHSICQDCLDEHFPEYNLDEE
ncbi:MAG: PAS domain S-box protein [Desulfobulbaceae bacterium]|nr:MAG: PAS domain S-box protein [Desulfobulbaceae bacterium]